MERIAKERERIERERMEKERDDREALASLFSPQAFDPDAAVLAEISDDLDQRRSADARGLRKAHFKRLTRQWHPDKNSERIETATKVFQMLQEKKEWFTD